MITLFNLLIWVLIFIGVIIFLTILYMIVRESEKKYIFSIFPILIGIILLLVIFYLPVKLKIDSNIHYKISVHNYGATFEMEDEEEGKKLIDILNRHTLTRSTEKTLLTGDRHYSNESISISVSSDDVQYFFVFLRKEATEYSYVLTMDGQYYSIKNIESFIEEILSFLSEDHPPTEKECTEASEIQTNKVVRTI
ncbi:hypothetical protein ACERII_09000 [Evansella sp. AB-rgal1]|uniref:hypothetical protein n=1 Tax=Evansella sp. AB-rgal1 TaxID=3242696 RepID=UPI00359D8915